MKRVLSWVLTLTGSAFVIFGIQAWAFHSILQPRIEIADANLIALLEEAPTNSLIDRALGTLRDYRSANSDELQRRQIMGLREKIVRAYRDNPRAVIDAAVRVAGGFSGDTDIEQELLALLRIDLLRLQEIYSDHYTAAIASFRHAPYYLQPTAALLSLHRPTGDRLDFNYALYLTLSADRSAADSIYSELRRSTDDDMINSRALYAQARLQFDAYRVDGDAVYFRQARQYAQESLSSDPTQQVAKMFLEYLLSTNQQAVDVETTPEEGQGSGESQGERGSLSSNATEH